MITMRETTENDLPDIQRLWADGDAMKFFSFPETCRKRIFSKKPWRKNRQGFILVCDITAAWRSA